MRRKSTRNTQKATPDKSVKEAETTPKTRRSRRRKRSPSKSSESEEELVAVAKPPPTPEETPDTTTKSHTPTDEDTSEEPVWKVTPTEENTSKGEIQKLKICLTRPLLDSPEKTKSRRTKSNSQTEDEGLSSEDKPSRRTRSQGSPVVRQDGLSSQEGDEDLEEKKGKGKSKGKHKSKIEKSPHLSEPELQTNNEISENVQVTPESPTIDKPVDNDLNKVDDDGLQNVNENVQRREIVHEESANNPGHSSDNEQENTTTNTENKNSDDDDDEPLSAIKKNMNENSSEKSETVTRSSSEVESGDNPPLELSDTVVESGPEIQQEDVTESQNAKIDSVISESEESHKVTAENEQQTTESVTEESSIKQNEVEDVEQKTPKEKSPEKSVEEKSPEKSVEEKSPEKSVEEKLPGKVETSEDAVIVEEVQETSPVLQVQEDVAEKKSDQNPPEIVQENPLAAVQEVQEDIPEKKPDVNPPEIVQENPLGAVQEVQEDIVQEKSDVNPPEIVQENPLEAEGSIKEATKEPTSSPKIFEEPRIVVRPPRRWLKRDSNYLKKDTESQDQEPADDTCHIKPLKGKRKWESNTNEDSPLVKVNLETIQFVWSTIDFPEEPDLHLEVEKERRRSLTEPVAKKLERKVSVEYKSDLAERPSFEKQSSVSSTTQDSEDNSNIIAFNRKISIVDDTASKLKPPPSPAKNPVSNILYITNLVRPFTVKQLKELLERTGKIQEEGFWTDRIKSKCYVQYETQEEAEATRNALHGVQWPIGNGKKLIIDYASEEDMNNAKNPPVPPPAPVQETKTSAKENLEPLETKPRTEEKIVKEVEKKRTDLPVREWDIGKKELRRDRSKSRERGRKHKRSPSPSDDFISRKQKKEEESVPQKLMDDLFLKTKATPSIYWQPLSPEEIAMKQQQRLIRMEEHKRRMEENARMKGREMGRGAFRRRYD